MNTTPFGFAIVDKYGKTVDVYWAEHLSKDDVIYDVEKADENHPEHAPHRLVELYTKEQIEPILRGLMRGDCFCEMAIGNPMCKSHDTGCKAATAFLHNIVEPESNGDADTEVELSQPTIDKFTTLIKSIAKYKGES